MATEQKTERDPNVLYHDDPVTPENDAVTIRRGVADESAPAKAAKKPAATTEGGDK